MQVKATDKRVIIPLSSRIFSGGERSGLLDVPESSRHTQRMTERPLKEVGALVEARRLDLKLSEAEVIAAADVDPKTYKALEAGSRWPQEGTRLKIEPVLHWGPGSIQRLRDGKKPTAFEPPGQRQSQSPAINYAPLIVGLAVDADDLLDSAKRIDTMFDVHIDQDDADEVESLVGNAETLIDDVDSLVTDLDEFVDVVNEYARKIVGAGQLYRMKNETRKLRRRQALEDGLRLFREDEGPLSLTSPSPAGASGEATPGQEVKPTVTPFDPNRQPIPHDYHPPADRLMAAHEPDEPKGQPEQGHAGGEENQDHDDQRPD